MTSYVLRPRPPLRAFAIAALLSLAGGVLVVVAREQRWTWVVVSLGGALLGLGIGLLLVGWLSMRQMRVRVDLDDEGYHVHGAGVDQHSPWTAIAKVGSSHDGAHLVFTDTEGARTHLWCPMGAGDPQMQRLSQDIADHLDRTNGYRHVLN